MTRPLDQKRSWTEGVKAVRQAPPPSPPVFRVRIIGPKAWKRRVRPSARFQALVQSDWLVWAGLVGWALVFGALGVRICS